MKLKIKYSTMRKDIEYYYSSNSKNALKNEKNLEYNSNSPNNLSTLKNKFDLKKNLYV